ncbi:hypothetical protein HOM13_00500 [Candidatus Woesearchaeota archaeon]|jgi:hypothetical protein|nr:hypothetical protein [Candidatus Woesearchaeota archaeon]MBT5215198.1 hypothetical protein [Candidatus Woesearchaeota archaeon]MBT6402315.1 hypothetical protein [Candidatus Woesearchaeota archaeon]
MTIRETLKQTSLPLILAGLMGSCSTVKPQETIDFAQITDSSIPTAIRDTYNFITLNANRSSRNPSTFSYGANFSLDGKNYDVLAQRNSNGRSLRVTTSNKPHKFILIDGYGGKPLDGITDYAGLKHTTEKGHSVDSEFKFPEDFQSSFDFKCTKISSALRNPQIDVTYSSTN